MRSRKSADGRAVLRDRDRDPRVGRMPSSVVDPKGGDPVSADALGSSDSDGSSERRIADVPVRIVTDSDP